MWQTLRNAWRIQDLRKKILYTLGMLLLYRLLSYVPTPFVNLANIREAMNQYDLLNFINMMTGSNIQDFTIMAMGITPYINASIIMQLLTVAIPKLEEMQKEGEEGRKKIAQITRYVTIGLGFLCKRSRCRTALRPPLRRRSWGISPSASASRLVPRWRCGSASASPRTASATACLC